MPGFVLLLAAPLAAQDNGPSTGKALQAIHTLSDKNPGRAAATAAAKVTVADPGATAATPSTPAPVPTAVAPAPAPAAAVAPAPAPAPVAPPTTVAPAPAPAPPPPVTVAPAPAPAPPPAPAAGGAAELDRAAATSLQLLNDLRASVGAAPLSGSGGMDAYARDWSRTMAQSGFRHSGGPYGENIVWYSDASLSPESAAARFHQMWVNSAGHYANMIDAGYTLVGVGFYHDQTGWYGTHVFNR